jgi:alpha-mannosidase
LLTGIEKTDNYQRLKFKTTIGITASYTIEAFTSEWTITLYIGIQQVRYENSIRWDDFNHRVRVAFPVCIDENKCRYLYGIPYGFIERKPYEPVHYWAGSNGDWPAIDWAGIETKDISIAVYNKGIPSYKIDKADSKGHVIYLTLLRSPTIPTYLHEPMSYSLTEWDGMRDTGSHFFEYALASYNSSLPESNVVCDAELYNKGFCLINEKLDLPAFPFKARSENIRITSIKKAEKDNGLIIRMAEYRGKAGKIDFSLSETVKAAYLVNLLENTEAELDISSGKTELQSKAFEILSLKIKM